MNNSGSTSFRNLVGEAPKDELLLSLEACLGPLLYACVIYWIPEQECDIYTVVVPERRVVTVELPRDHAKPIYQIVTLQEYRRANRKLSVEKRRNLAAVEKLIAGFP
jgi:hypothetical protein